MADGDPFIDISLLGERKGLDSTDIVHIESVSKFGGKLTVDNLVSSIEDKSIILEILGR